MQRSPFFMSFKRAQPTCDWRPWKGQKETGLEETLPLSRLQGTQDAPGAARGSGLQTTSVHIKTAAELAVQMGWGTGPRTPPDLSQAEPLTAPNPTPRPRAGLSARTSDGEQLSAHPQQETRGHALPCTSHARPEPPGTTTRPGPSPSPGRRKDWSHAAWSSLCLYWPRLLEGDEAGGVGGADPGPAVLHGLVGDGELAQIVADHLGLREANSRPPLVR